MRVSVGGFRSKTRKGISRHLIHMLVLALSASTVTACGTGFAGKEGPSRGLDRIAVTGRALLIEDQAEEGGYGLYSYLLFELPPNAV